MGFKKTLVSLLLGTTLGFGGLIDKTDAAINSNSTIRDNIEYYMQTDKSIYNLGENVHMLYRITNLSQEKTILIFDAGPADDRANFTIKQNENIIWQNLNRPITGAPVFIDLDQSGSFDFVYRRGPWVIDSFVNPGIYEALGILDNHSLAEHRVPLSVQIEIKPEPTTPTLIAGLAIPLQFYRRKDSYK